MKKLWDKPELIILIKSTPEEAVLVNCKVQVNGQEGPDASVHSCRRTGSCGNGCDVLVDS